jgi:hypothetical protein
MRLKGAAPKRVVEQKPETVSSFTTRGLYPEVRSPTGDGLFVFQTRHTPLALRFMRVMFLASLIINRFNNFIYRRYALIIRVGLISQYYNANFLCRDKSGIG